MSKAAEPPLADPQHIPRLVSAEADALDEFVQLLETEQEALAAGEIDRLLPLAEQKNLSAGRLADMARQRNQALGAAALAADRVGMDAWLARHPGAAAVRRDWERLLGAAARARNLNELNGRLIAERVRHNQQALAALMAAGEQAALYGPDGQQRISGAGSTLGRA